MPELPEVETIAEDLRQSGLLGLEIVRVDILFPKIAVGPLDLLKGKKILSVGRRGKFIVFKISDRRSLFIHLRMSGRLRIASEHDPVQKHEHIVITFKPGIQLRYCDPRQFGRWYLVEDAQKFTGKLGPEPLGPTFDLPGFKQRLLAKKRQLKPLLLDQSFVAGLGNIYVDEALWEAKIHPQTLSCQLTSAEIKRLFTAIQHVLKRGIATKGTTLRDYIRLEGAVGQHQTILNVFRRTGQPCPRCGTRIQKMIVGQRSTHICPECQKPL